MVSKQKGRGLCLLAHVGCSSWILKISPGVLKNSQKAVLSIFTASSYSIYKFPPYLRIIFTEFWYENLRTQLSRPSSILHRSRKFCIWTSVWQILYSLGHSVLHINLPSKSSERFYVALWIQNYDLCRYYPIPLFPQISRIWSCRYGSWTT